MKEKVFNISTLDIKLKYKSRMYLITIGLLFFLVTACVFKVAQEDLKNVYTQLDHKEVINWGKDNQLHKVLPSFAKSCAVFIKEPKTKIVTMKPTLTLVADWQKVCVEVLQGKVLESNVQKYFEDNFNIYRVGNQNSGFITGYYHIFLKGSRKKNNKYKYPIYGVPKDLIKIDLKNFEVLENFSGSLMGRVESDKVVPYYSAAEIDSGAIKNKAKVIAYAASRLDVFLLHVQGSGTLFLNDGSKIKLDYADQNGLPYQGLSKALVEGNYIARGEVNLQSMQEAYKNYKEEITKIILDNKSYVFVKESRAKDVIGGMGVGLTPKRSVAVDTNYIPYGVPVWLEIPNYDGIDINQLVVAQDRGGAIRGANRIDFYWGEGDEAGILAGNTKHNGSVYILLPK